MGPVPLSAARPGPPPRIWARFEAAMLFSSGSGPSDHAHRPAESARASRVSRQRSRRALQASGIGVALTVLVAAASPAHAEWQRFSAADGLPSNDVVAILEDRSGDLWFGGNSGVTRYDGATWRTFTTADGLVNDAVYDLLEDRAGRLWCAGHFGVSRLDESGWTRITVADGLASDWVNGIIEDRAGRIWIATTRGASRWDGSAWRTFTAADGLGGDGMFAVAEDSSGAIWFATWRPELAGYESAYTGVSRFDGTSWRTFTTADGLASNYVSGLFVAREGTVWAMCGTVGADTAGVCRYDGTRWAPFTVPDAAVIAMMQDRAGSLWFESPRGASRFDGRHWRTFTRADGLADDAVIAMMQDRAGNLWFGGRYGVTRFDGSTWANLTRADGIAADVVTAVVEDRDERIWLATWGGGVSRLEDGVVTTFTTADGLADDEVHSALEDRDGNLWFGTNHGGASRFDGATWTTFLDSVVVDPGLPPHAAGPINTILQDRSGDLWFGTGVGAYRYDGTSWAHFTVADGLAGDEVLRIMEDRSGILWFGTYHGLSRFDGTGWQTFGIADGLADSMVVSMVEDQAGNLWFGGRYGATRFDGNAWRIFTTADGLPEEILASLFCDRAGNLWLGGLAGVSRFDGERWGHYSVADGLVSNLISSISEDRSGAIWLTTPMGASRLEPDSVPPRAVITPRPEALSASASQTFTFSAAFGETRGIQYSWSLDGLPWSDWSPTSFLRCEGMTDGPHRFEVRARDQIGNLQPQPTACSFETDATPPTPVIVSPTSGEPVRDTVSIRGTASDARFRSFRLEGRSLSAAAWDQIAESDVPVADGMLGRWATAPLPDGDYELRLLVTDTLGLTGTALVRVIVDNHEPWAAVTAPATVSAATGGHLYTTNGELNLYFPPHAFTRDALVSIQALPDSAVPDSLGAGRPRMLSGYEVSWAGGVLTKPATLELSLADAAPRPGTPALYSSGADSVWRRVGGTMDATSRRISAPLTAPGRYALFSETEPPPGAGGLVIISLTPRVFSPLGGFANRRAAVSFALGRPGSVSTRIYNRAGRLVRELANGTPFGAGENVLYWDGQDLDGSTVEDGIYLVSIEALGEKQVRTLAVVR